MERTAMQSEPTGNDNEAAKRTGLEQHLYLVQLSMQIPICLRHALSIIYHCLQRTASRPI